MVLLQLLYAIVSAMTCGVCHPRRLRRGWPCASSRTEPQARKRLLVVGASFGGLAVVRELCDDPSFDVTVVEPKDYVEYTPSTLKAMVHTSHAAHIQVPIRTAVGDCTHVRAKVVAVHTHKDGRPGGVVDVEHTEGGRNSRLEFDMCVLATGSSYPSAAKANVGDVHAGERLAAFHSLARALRTANSVAIVGGGPVGVELAAELIVARPASRVQIFTAASRLLDHFPIAVSKAAETWMREHGVRMHFSDRVNNIKHHGTPASGAAEWVTFDTTREVGQHADVLVFCAGAKAESAYLQRSSPVLQSALHASGRILVDSAFRVQGCEAQCIFAIGDVAAHPLPEPAMAHTAEKHAECVVHTLRELAHAKTISAAHVCAYPEGLTGVPSAPVIAAVSLGPYESLVFFDWIVVADRLVGSRLGAVLKWTIEQTKLLQMKRHPLGVAFWRFGDAASVVMHRYFTAPLAGGMSKS